jgi:uncharacterized protein YdeI (YjbR/CyaY-like superfamily)
MVAAAGSDFRHAVPPDLDERLIGDPALAAMWERLTDLARNEWICWFTSAKQARTRATRLTRLHEEVAEGKKRPCCWPGCPHRREPARKRIDA